MTEKQEKIKTLAEDYKMVLNEAKSMGCKNIKALYNILLEDMELIVQSLEKQIPKQNDGWISIDERLPDTNDYILLSFSNFTIPVVGRYETEKRWQWSILCRRRSRNVLVAGFIRECMAAVAGTVQGE